jgi:amino acid adenylation domain-containing protein
MRADIAELVGDPRALDRAGGDLIAVGLDSLQVMRLAARWRAAGVPVSFAELFERPSFAHWSELVAQRQAVRAARPAPVPELVDVDESAPFPLATMQHAYWVGRDEHLPLGGVATHFYAELDGAAVEPERLRAAGRALLARHGMLRARILDDGRQQILAESPWPGPTVHDLRHRSPAEVTAALAATRDRLSHRRLDVAAGEVFDLRLSLLPDRTTRLHLNIDMLVADALSFRIIINDLAALYADPGSSLPAIGYSYPRYLADRRARPAPGRAGAERHWAGRLPGLPRAPRLPLAAAPEKLPGHRVTRRHHWLPPRDWQVLAGRARGYGVTLSMVFAAAYSEVLATWSEEPDFLLNLPLFDREPVHPDVGSLVGDFSSLLVLGVHTAPEVPFAELVRRLQARFVADAGHAAHSGLAVLRELASRDGAAQTLAPVVFTSAIGLGELFSPAVTGHLGRLGWSISQAPQVWLDHQVTEHAGGLLLNWDAVAGLLAPGVLDAMFAGYRDLLGWLAGDGDWDRPVPPLLPAGQAARRAALNRTAGRQREHRLPDAFFRRAAADPDRVALLWGESGRLSYGALADRADRVAGLLAGRGCRPGDPVGVTLPKGPGQVAAVLGILRAGAGFVPVGTGQPAARRAALYADAGVRWVLTDTATRAAPGWPEPVEVLTLADAEPAGPLADPPEVDPAGLAYVIYTSGSTGRPKGVEMSHRAAANTIEDLGDRGRIGPDDRGLAVSALDHDWSVYDLFAYLSAGGALVLPEEGARRDPHRWAELVRRHRVTVWTSVPALLDMLLTAAGPDQLGSLRLALVGGDWVGLDLAGRLAGRAPGCRLVALGGATEVGIHSTWHEVTELPAHWRSVPYGSPLRNQRVRVVNPRGRDCPDWVPGELWLGGTGVGTGYRGDPERTADRFLTRDGHRWYRTGDRCRFRPDGTLELLGRVDSQVKLLGERVDPQEVEAVLRAHPGVAAAVAVVTAPGTSLAAAVVPAGAGVAPEQLLGYAREHLPEHLVPRWIRPVDELPLTGNGKLDRAAVARWLAGGGGRPVTGPPRGERETALARRWSELLGVATVGRDDSFFALGGDSLLATRLVADLRRAGFAGATLTRLFATPTLRGFARQLTAGEAPAPVAVPADPANRYQPFEATEVQRAYWLGRRPEFPLGGVGSHWYWELDGPDVDLARLERAWNRLVARHDMLRAVFDPDGRQRVRPGVPPVRVPVVEAGPGPAAAELAALRERMAHRVFDPARWPLFDLQAVRYGGRRTRLGVSLDFLVLDALSIMTIFAELSELYRDPQARLPPLRLTFRDLRQAGLVDPDRAAAARDYWAGRLAQLPPAPQLPLARDPRRLSGARFTRRELRLPAADWQPVRRRAGALGVTPSTVVATAFATVLGGWSATGAFTLNLTLFDRPEVDPDIYRVVGDFTSLLLLENRPVPGESFAAAASRLQRQLFADLEHRAHSGIAVLRDLARHTGTPEVLMPVVFTSTLGVRSAGGQRFDLAMPFGDYHAGLSQTPQVWLDHQVTERAGGLLLSWDAVEELFCPGVLDAMFAAYRELLARLAREPDWHRPIRPSLPRGQAEVRRRVNATAAPGSGRLLPDGLFEQARRRPAGTAVLAGEGSRLSYGELADRARRLAAGLAARGVAPGDRVAVTLPAGPDQLVAVLGILAAGGVYVPVGTDQPAHRRERIYRSCGARLVLTEPAAAPPGGPEPVLVGDALRHPPAAPVRVAERQPGYLIYTSGSTGEPKGVVVSHASAVNTIDDINARFRVGAGDRVLAVSALDFDLSVYDVFGLLAAGGAVVLPDPDRRRDAGHWLRLARAHRVSLWNSVPALLDMLLVAAGEELPGSLRLALVSGDWIGLDLPGRLATATGGRCRLVALGGATEAAIWSNAFEVDQVPPGWTSIPYGRPLRNQRFRVVDGEGADRPDWVPGELWIGGAGVALGYHGDPERTAARFPVVGGQRWYRTGDLGRYRPDGTLELLGRTDQQVKVRGHRIELGEVEAALAGLPAVGQAVACALGDRTRRRLAAAVTPAGAGPVDPRQVRERLAERLPDHLVPGQIEVLPRMPLTPNGKLDRAAVAARLAEGAGAPAGGDHPARPPRGETEAGIAQLWQSLLERPVRDRDGSFFDAGGDSLLATRLVQRIRHRFGVEVSLPDLWDEPSVAGQARLVSARRDRLAAGGPVEEGQL